MFSRFPPWRYSIWVAGLVAVVWLACFRFPMVWIVTGIGEANRPFLDLYALLAAYDAMRQGLDPLMPNPLDPYHRPFGFSTWWFELEPLGFGRKDVLWLGWMLVSAALFTAVAMVRPKDWRNGASLGLLLVSPAVLLSINRANQDLVVFLIVSLGLVCFRSAGQAVRLLGSVLFAIAAVLKFFPLVTVLLLLEFRSRRQLAWGAFVYGSVMLLAWPSLAPALRLAGKHVPAPEWLYAFGAPSLARDFGVTAAAAWLVPALVVIALAFWSACRLAEKEDQGAGLRDDATEREFICGAVMLVGVFFLGVSFLYKMIFAVWLLPWLWERRSGHRETRWARILGGLLFAVVWLEGAAASLLNLTAGAFSDSTVTVILKGVLVVTQLLTWALMACLLRFVGAYLWRRIRQLRGGQGYAGLENELPARAS